MTTLPSNYENMGGRILRKTDDTPLGSQGNTIGHPLKGPLPGEASHALGAWNVANWTNGGASDFPSNLGAEVAHGQFDTLDEALAATV